MMITTNGMQSIHGLELQSGEQPESTTESDRWDRCQEILLTLQQRLDQGYLRLTPLLDAVSDYLIDSDRQELDSWIPLQLQLAEIYISLQQFQMAADAYADVEFQIAENTSPEEYEKRLDDYAECLLGQAAALYQNGDLHPAQQKIEMYLGLAELIPGRERLVWAQELRSQIDEALRNPAAQSLLERNLAQLLALTHAIEDADKQEQSIRQEIETLSQDHAAAVSQLAQTVVQSQSAKVALEEIQKETAYWEEQRAWIIAPLTLPLLEEQSSEIVSSPYLHPFLEALMHFTPAIVRTLEAGLENGDPMTDLESKLSPFTEHEAALYRTIAEARRLQTRGESGVAPKHIYQGWQRYLYDQRQYQNQLSALEQNLRERYSALEEQEAALQALETELNHSKEQLQLAQAEIAVQVRSIQEREQVLLAREISLNSLNDQNLSERPAADPSGVREAGTNFFEEFFSGDNPPSPDDAPQVQQNPPPW